MSDPVTNAEIEDVLSSIRRLVSTDDREDPSAQKTVSGEHNKLVLTPSQRVDDAADSGDADKGQQDGSAPVEAAFLAQYAVEPGVESEVSPSAGVPQDEDHTKDDDHTDPAAEVPEFKHHREDAPEAENDLEVNAKAPEAQDAAKDAFEAEGGDPMTDTTAGDEAQALEGQDGGIDLQAKIASVEAALAGRDDEWEPDGDDDYAYGGSPVTRLEWDDHSEAVNAADATALRFEAAQDEGFEPEKEELSDDFTPSANERDGQLGQGAPDEALEEGDPWELQADVLDEDALRDMVSEIVRQELQGALGERITRNVRKLVRREIHRALASQDFE
ncbi:hypothetical protein [Roseovarius sp. MMSF_3281]|uniref:hypothetical protein n=1 Tax=Roseovarius sp. MMSF_3281 TaxID=3046694 RepID=UPI00273D37C1|nr:hypothetical protein [Roseovarius sp. MMSF_3281]